MYNSYFQQTSVKITQKWSEKERSLLIRGIEKYGIGNWEDIRIDYLPDWVSFSIYTNGLYLMLLGMYINQIQSGKNDGSPESGRLQ